jgi:hypothetical protein
VPKSSTASERRTPAFFYAALDGWIKGTQVQAPYPCPNSSGRMVFADEVLHIHGSAAHRLSVHGAKQRLFADRIFLAHAASLRQTSFFARWKFRGFLHSFKLKRVPPGDSTAVVWVVWARSTPTPKGVHNGTDFNQASR